MLKSKYFPYIFLVIFGLLFPEGFLALFSGYLTGALYSIGRLAFTEPSDNCIAKVNGTVMKPFVNNPAYMSQNASLDNPQPGFSMFQQPFPAPGGSGGGSAAANNQSNAQNNSNQTRTPASQAPKPFAGKGVSVGSNLTGYQGSSNNNANTYSVQQTIREEAKGPNPLTQKSKLVKEHYEKNKQEEQETHSDDEDADEHDDLEKNPDKKNNSDDLLNFSN